MTKNDKSEHCKRLKELQKIYKSKKFTKEKR